MKEWWSQVGMDKAWLSFGGIVLLMGALLYGYYWSPLIEECERINGEIQQHKQDLQEILPTIGTLKKTEHELASIRESLQVWLQQISSEAIEPQNFRKEIMRLAKGSGVTVRSWRPDSFVFSDRNGLHNLRVTIRIEGGFYQAVVFLDGLQALPWVQSIGSIKMEKIQNPKGQSSILMNVTVQGVQPMMIDQVRRLLAT